MPSDRFDPDIFDIALRAAAGFDAIGAPYYLTGSVASSLQAEPRFTNDIDFVVDLKKSQVGPFAKALGEEFDVDENALAEAVAQNGSWNIFYLPLFTKIDLFMLGRSPFQRSAFSRRSPLTVRADGAKLFSITPEDSVLQKLMWWRDGGQVSSTQWRDVVQVLRVGGAALDTSYLDHWAREQGLEGELLRARREAAEVE